MTKISNRSTFWPVLFLSVIGPHVAFADTATFAAQEDMKHVRIEGLNWGEGPFEVRVDPDSGKKTAIITGITSLRVWKINSREASRISYKNIESENKIEP